MENELNIEGIKKILEFYHLEDCDITDAEWQTFLDDLAAFFESEGKSNSREPAANLVIRRSFNLAMMDSADVFTIYYVIEALDDLRVFNISQSVIDELKNIMRKDVLKSRTHNQSKKLSK